jgi:uncharacterized protein
MPRISLMPREDKFFDLFEASAQNVAKSARALKELVDTWENVAQQVDKITELEHEGDAITHRIMEQLHRSFITPFDREDIALLAHSLDDIIDFIQAAADTMLLYKVERPSQTARDLAEVIVQCADEVARGMPFLRQRGKLKQLLEACVEMNRLENVADSIYRAALGELFNSSDIAGIIKWREIYEQMESATDRCEDVADVLEGVALKHG